jgi:hypothetical protein
MRTITAMVRKVASSIFGGWLMSDQTDPNDFWGVGGIEHNPEVAARLGQFLAEFATLEACLVWMLGFIIGGNNKEEVAWALLGPVQNVTTRCQMVRDAAEKSGLDVLAKGGITDFVDTIQKMNAVRNDYVHAVYETNARSREVRRTPFALSTTRKKQGAKPVTANELVMHINIMRSIAREVMQTFLGHLLMPVPDPSPDIRP